MTEQELKDLRNEIKSAHHALTSVIRDSRSALEKLEGFFVDDVEDVIRKRLDKFKKID